MDILHITCENAAIIFIQSNNELLVLGIFQAGIHSLRNVCNLSIQSKTSIGPHYKNLNKWRGYYCSEVVCVLVLIFPRQISIENSVFFG